MNQVSAAFPVDPEQRVSFLHGGLVVGESFLLPTSCRFYPLFVFPSPLAS